jgi:6-phosphogluconolactonase (cycloisomerase 2 family)
MSAIRSKRRWVYVGSRTEDKAKGKGISVYAMDTASGEWTLHDVVGGLTNPAFLAFDRSGRYLYTVHGDHTGVTAFRVDPETGKLTTIGFQPTDINPVHLASDPSNRYLVVANVRGGNLSLLPIQSDGTPGPVCDSVTAEPGLREGDRPRSRPHHCPLDRSGRFIVVPDKGLDRVYVYQLDVARGRLIAIDPPYVQAPAGAGPRHVDFHPEKPWAYVVNELSSSISAYRFDAGGALTLMQTISTLPPEFKEENTGAEIWVTPNGRFVIASNRGHDSLAICAVDMNSGALTLTGWESTRGRGPRYFGLDPSGHFLYAANENGHNITGFVLDQDRGRLTPTGLDVSVGSPVCIAFSGTEA